jgi:hypothetical protein
MEKTRLYLDVDGVLNASFPDQNWGVRNFGQASAGDAVWGIVWAPELITALAELDVELVWTTTWRDDDKSGLADLLGWGHHGRVLHPSAENIWPSIDWKFEAVINDQLASPGRFIWVDDELDNGVREATHRVFPMALLLEADPVKGVTKEQIEMMKLYLSKGI